MLLLNIVVLCSLKCNFLCIRQVNVRSYKFIIIVYESEFSDLYLFVTIGVQFFWNAKI